MSGGLAPSMFPRIASRRPTNLLYRKHSQNDVKNLETVRTPSRGATRLATLSAGRHGSTSTSTIGNMLGMNINHSEHSGKNRADPKLE